MGICRFVRHDPFRTVPSFSLCGWVGVGVGVGVCVCMCVYVCVSSGKLVKTLQSIPLPILLYALVPLHPPQLASSGGDLGATSIILGRTRLTH